MHEVEFLFLIALVAAIGGLFPIACFIRLLESLESKKRKKKRAERWQTLVAFCASSAPENNTAVLAGYAKALNCANKPYGAIDSKGSVDVSLLTLRYIAICCERNVCKASARIASVCETKGRFRNLAPQSCDILASCIRRLYALHVEAWELYESVLQPLFELDVANSVPVQEQLCSYIPRFREFQAQTLGIMEDIDHVENNIVSDICATAPVPTKSVKQQSALANIIACTKKIKSQAVRTRMDSLGPKISVYMEDEARSVGVDTRINSYYLPSLELALSSLLSAEKKHSKKTTELEMLALRLMDVIEEVLDARQDDLDAKVAQRVEVEVKTAEGLAALKGDLGTQGTGEISI